MILLDNQFQLFLQQQMQGFISKYKFYVTYFPLIVGMATAFVYFEQNYMFFHISQQTQNILTAFNILTYTLIILSYIQAIRVNSNLPKDIPFPRIKTQLKNNHPHYIYPNKCQKDQDRYKPNRTSHCSKDGCVVRFDHHCSWTNNCVGHRNQKIYLLLTFYGGILYVQFFILSIYNYIQITRSGVTKLGENEVSIWMLFTFLSFFFILFLMGLTLSTLKFVSNNVTYIDMLKGVFTINDKEGLHPNPYDLEVITNFATVFEGETWKFWLPTAGNVQYDGTKYPMAPPITEQDKKTLFENIQDYLKDPIERSVPKTYEDFYVKEYQKYQDTIFHYLGEEYTLEGMIQKPNKQVNVESKVQNNESEIKNEQHQKEAEDILANVYDQAEA